MKPDRINRQDFIFILIVLIAIVLTWYLNSTKPVPVVKPVVKQPMFVHIDWPREINIISQDSCHPDLLFAWKRNDTLFTQYATDTIGTLILQLKYCQ